MFKNVSTTLSMKNTGGVWLYAPELYLTLPAAERKKLVNGCGPGGWKIDLVPDTIWGLDISEACNIHDFMYLIGTDLAAKEEADRVFLNNTLRLIDSRDSMRWLKKLRRQRAREYYEAVHLFGGPAYWHGKNPTINMLQLEVKI